jgi:hypothetical protein
VTETPECERALVLARARRNLAERALRAAVNDAALAGASAIEVARGLRVTRPEAEDLLAELARERGPDGHLPDDPYTIAERYAVGELPRERMLELLSGWEYPAEREDREWDEIRVKPEGAFNDTVGRALRDGLLRVEDYDEILRRTP